MHLIRIGDRIINGDLIEFAKRTVTNWKDDKGQMHGDQDVNMYMTNSPDGDHFHFEGEEADCVWKMLDLECSIRTPGSEGV